MTNKTNPDNTIEEILDALFRFPHVHETYRKREAIANLVQLFKELAEELIGDDEKGHAAVAGTTYRKGKTKRNALREEQRAKLERIIKESFR